MNDFNTYLTQLQNALKGFTPAERDEFMAEIKSHIEDGLDDPAINLPKEKRIKMIIDELGPPLELGNGLQESNWRHRWLDFLLALVPLLIIYLVRFGTIVVLNLLDKADPISVMLIPLLVITPSYFAMIFIGQRRRSLVLMVWWASLTTVFLSNAIFMGLAGAAPLWMLVIWITGLVSVLGLLGYKLRQHRQNGLLLALALLPIMLQLAQKALGIFSIHTLSAEFYGEHSWYALWINNIFFISVVALIFLFPQRHIRWLGLVMAATIYLLAVFMVWETLTAFVFFGPLMLFPVIAGILEEYRYQNRNPFVPA